MFEVYSCVLSAQRDGGFRQEEWGREQYHKYKESVLIRVLPLLSSRDLFFWCVCVRVGGWVWERVRGREE